MVGTKRIHLMEISKQLMIAWIRKAGDPRDRLVVVHSRPVNSSDADEAWQKFKDGKAIDGVMPIVFLDDQLDSPELRSWLQKEAIHRRYLI